MSMTDPIADMLTRIRNANQAKLDKVVCPKSKLKIRILEIMREEGYIKEFKVTTEGKFEELVIQLRYLEDKKPVILGLQRVSCPGLRQYVKHNAVPRTRGGMGMRILSTSQGVMSDREAKQKGIGGEVLCSVW